MTANDSMQAPKMVAITNWPPEGTAMVASEACATVGEPTRQESTKNKAYATLECVATVNVSLDLAASPTQASAKIGSASPKSWNPSIGTNPLKKASLR